MEINSDFDRRVNYDQLFELLFASEAEIPISRLYELSDMPSHALNVFTNRWRSVPAERREVIARHLADICEENFTVDYTPFARLFFHDSAEKVRLAGLDICWDASRTDLIKPLIELMNTDPSVPVRASAAATLGHYVLMVQWGEIGEEIEGPIVSALLTQFEDQQNDRRIQRAALESMASAADPRIAPLIERAYRDRDEGMKKSAVFAMGRSAEKRWIPMVTAALDSDDPLMRAEAARAAGSIGTSEFVPRLADIARFDEDIEPQLAAIFALGQIGSDEASETLTRMLEDEDFEELYEDIEEAMEQLLILGHDLDLSILDWDARDWDDNEAEDDLDD